MPKPSSASLAVGLCLTVSAIAAGTSSAFAAGITHTGASAASHMELKNAAGAVVCSAYDTPATSKPVATGCPSGTYLEQLFNAGWTEIGKRNVTLGTAPPPASGTHTGGQAAPHMELKNAAGGVVCSAYNTPTTSKPVATGCPNGTYLEQLFDTGWTVIAQRNVTVGSPTTPPATGGTKAPLRNANPAFAAQQNVPSAQLQVEPLSDYPANFQEDPSSKDGHPNDGNFRVTCQYSHFNYDDPIVYPGQKSAAHLHMFFGNTKTDAYTTASSLVASGGGSCNGFALNRSGYWTPAVLDGQGNAVVPYQILVYYKTKFADKVVRMPQGLKMLAGAVMGTPMASGGTEHLFWSCGPNGTIKNKSGTIPSCGADPINATVYFPECWNGNLDSADHRSHLKQIGPAETCPSSHPKRLPRIGVLMYFKPQSTAGWSLSSDHGGPRGGSLHADWMGGWHDGTMDRWVNGCLKARKNCNIARTGTNLALKRLNGTANDDWTGPDRVTIPSL